MPNHAPLSLDDSAVVAAEQGPDEALAGELLDSASLDWSRITRARYLLHQNIGYTYPAPIADLRHRFLVVPPARHGDQVRIAHRLSIAGARAICQSRFDDFGNLVIDVNAPRVDEQIDLRVSIAVERNSAAEPLRLPAGAATDLRLLELSPLTRPGPTLRKAAAWLKSAASGRLDLARATSTWVHGQMTYEHGVTTVGTTASEALLLGRGVCQDHAHIMLTLCRLNGLPARYVSGHLLGEGGTHAWVEVLLPDPANPGSALVTPFDPTQASTPGLKYVTVAVGRDYADVAPTSGTFRSGVPGKLTTSRRLGVTAVDYDAPGAETA